MTSRVLKNDDGIVMTVRAFHCSPLLAGDGNTRPLYLCLHLSGWFGYADVLFHAHTSNGSSYSVYVGIEEQEDDGEPFEEKMGRLTSELSELFIKSHELEAQIKERLGAIGYDI